MTNVDLKPFAERVQPPSYRSMAPPGGAQVRGPRTVRLRFQPTVAQPAAATVDSFLLLTEAQGCDRQIRIA